MKFYSEPAQPSLINFWLGLTAVLVWTYIMSFIYAMLIAVCPLIYVNFLITLGFSMCLGIGVVILGKVFKITQRKNITLIEITSSILAIYFSWIATIYYFIPGVSAVNEYFLSPSLLIRPFILFEIIGEINKVGLWSIFGSQMTGIYLALVWIVEITIIVFTSYKITSKFDVQPFAIKSNKWYKKSILFKDFEGFSYLPEFANKINENALDTLSSLGNGSAYSFGQVTIFHLKDEETYFISLHNIGRNRSGKSESSKAVISLMEISKTDAEILLERFKYKRKWFLDF